MKVTGLEAGPRSLDAGRNRKDGDHPDTLEIPGIQDEDVLNAACAAECFRKMRPLARRDAFWRGDPLTGVFVEFCHQPERIRPYPPTFTTAPIARVLPVDQRGRPDCSILPTRNSKGHNE